MVEEFYDVLFDQVKFFDMIVFWYEQQKVIQVGQCDIELFVCELMDYIVGEVVGVKENGLVIKVDMYFCLFCVKLLCCIKKKEKNEFFWGCIGFVDGCKFVCEDKVGKLVL